MEIKKGYVDISAGQIHYAWRGGTGAPIVCFHQTASSGTSYHRIMENSNLSQPIYALDTPGFGGSFDPQEMPTFEQYAAWLYEAIEALDLGPFHAMGHHTGAGICVELSATHRASVKSMMLVGPYPLSAAEREEFRPNFSTPISPNEDGEYLLTTWKYLRGLGAHGELEVHHRELLNHVRAYYSRFQTYSSVWDYDFTTPYKNASCPILIMAAEKDVLYPYLERSKEMQPGATLVRLTGANFEPELDAEGIVEAINAFLA